ncbi:SDR family oxidoreductase [Aspergillus fijiensis CBS 313.89]|uniref:IBR finger domain protein n=1 Tax=Aspergillus fijiensis CBS 313.89 TaxID=1448319 RepID=A0A8G1RLY1_9EURO|nr:IBR finger domain protein [Aspergillus fijiensis CBS 313.89]RAK75710.1 IBR finger domain protein [Aspergillus fijiensis CBS 313.89]
MSSKRSVLITGCSDGSLGSALALQFHQAGWRVFATARNPAKLKEAEKAGIETVLLDTLSNESIRACVARVQELTGGSLDALINNAGGGYSMPVMDIEIPIARDLFELNVWSLISVAQAFLPLLLESARTGGPGRGPTLLVNHTSISGTIGATGPFAGAYNASKAAASSFTETLRLELEPFGIKVINLVTGAVQSTFHDKAPHPTLPASSLYNVAKETVERALTNTDPENDTPAAAWAKQVVRDLSKRTPPYWIWRGKLAMMARIAGLLPLGFFDGTMKKWVGLDVVEQRWKEQVKASS